MRLWIVALTAIASFAASANAQEYPGCFLVDKNGRYVNLPDLCPRSPEPLAAPASPSNNDAKFITEFKSFIGSEKNPAVRDRLLTVADNNPDALIKLGKAICQSLEGGTSSEEVRATQAEGLVAQNPQDPLIKEASTSMSAFAKLAAIATYCPTQPTQQQN